MQLAGFSFAFHIARICVAHEPYSMAYVLQTIPHNSCVPATRQESPRQPFYVAVGYARRTVAPSSTLAAPHF